MVTLTTLWKDFLDHGRFWLTAGFLLGFIVNGWLIPDFSQYRLVRVVDEAPTYQPHFIPSDYSSERVVSDLDIEREEELAALDVIEVEPVEPRKPVARKKPAVKRVSAPPPPPAPVFELTAFERSVDSYRKNYIAKYASVAQAAATSRVPASYLLALALVRGGSEYALKANNHFDVRCTSKTCPKGHCLRSDHHEQHKWFFVRYPDAAASYSAQAKADFVNESAPDLARVTLVYNLKRFDK